MAKKLQNLTNSNDENAANMSVHDFDGLAAALLSVEEFRNHQVSRPNSYTLNVEYNEVTVRFVDVAAITEKKQFADLNADLPKPDTLMVCTGTDEELIGFFAEYGQTNFTTLYFPCGIKQLTWQIHNFFHSQRLVLESEESRKNVQDTSEAVKYIMRISRELNGIRDTNRLLSLILQKAREITNADAGSIYVVEWHNVEKREGTIHFKISQNESVSQNLAAFKMPLDENSVVGNAILHERAINIPDLYQLNDDPSKNPYRAKHFRVWDERIGYESHSMLTLPMLDISNQVIGVIQLINKKLPKTGPLRSKEDFKRVVPFDETTIEYAEIVAHQAGIALENALLTEEKEQLFEGFVHASVTAIEQRDPTTSGHSHRVAKLTVGIAELINRTDSGPYSKLTFNEDQLKEIEYASLLHDFGKLGVREEVLVKAKKLYPAQKELILERFEHVRSRYEIEYLEEVIKYLNAPDIFPPGFSKDALKASRDKKLTELAEFLAFILKANEPTVLEQGGFEKLKDIANIHFENSHHKKCPLLRDNELKALSVSRGSLTREEFAEIQSHVIHTYEFLRKIPWGSKFANVPQIAAKHHEKLDGSGYPTAAVGNEIPIQSRIMTIADMFDALTAADRPYKKAVPVEKALDIIYVDVKAGRCDAELFDIFVKSQIYKSVIGIEQESA
jgi:HD-GYP domain-containing protein (c-di-GMP phosphodiesterase class II)